MKKTIFLLPAVSLAKAGLALLFPVALPAQQPTPVNIGGDAKVGVIVTGSGNTINTTQIFGKSPEYAELKKRLDGLAAAILKKAGECEQMAKDSLPQKYRDACRAELIALNAERDSVQKIETRFREDVVRLAEAFSKIELNSERLRLAKQFFDEGKIREADNVLNVNEMKIEGEALLTLEKRQKQEAAATDSLLRVKANEWLIKAQVTKTHYDLPAWFDSTTYYFRQSLHCRKMARNTFDFAYFLQEHNQHDSSIVYYNSAAGKYLSEKDTTNWLSTQNNLGNLYLAKNDFVRAEAAHLDILEIRKRLAKANPQTYEPDVAQTQNNFGALYWNKNDFARAEAAYLEALEIYKRLAKDNPQTYESDVAMTQSNLGLLYGDKKDFSRAETAYLESLEIRKRLAKDNPQTYEPDVAMTQNNLGLLYRDKNDFARAEAAYLEALEIRKRLTKANPQTYEPYVATTQNNLGCLYRDKNDFARAETVFLEALKIRKQLAKTNPQTYEPDVAMTQKNLGDLHSDKNDFARAVTAYLEALEIYERLAESNLALFESYFTETNGNLSFFYLFVQKFSDAQAAAERALALDPTQNWVRTNLGHSYLLRGDWDKAKAVYEQYIAGEKNPVEAKKSLEKDWDDLEKAGVTHPDIEKARKWVKE